MPCLELKIQNSKFKNIFGVWSLEFGHFKNGFTFIELLIVISLMAIVAASVSAAFLNFEKRQRVKEAALMVKNGIRTMQNNATSGKDVNCTGTLTLAGWTFSANVGSSVFFYAVYCGNPPDFASYGSSLKSLKLPQGVTFMDIKYGPIGGSTVSVNSLRIFTRTLKMGFSFHQSGMGVTSFFNSDTGDLVNLVGTMPQDPVTIILSGSGVTYGVVVMPSGEVYETPM
jgi:prepilin-type N-terminal cleavage/methylation domain-containing protein